MPKPRRVALMLDLEWPYKRHVGIFAGTQQYADEQGWETVVEEFAEDALDQRRSKSAVYDGIIARATKPLAERAARLSVPVVNVWFSSPARDMLPGVFADYTVAGRMRAEHLLARGFRNFAALTSRPNRGHDLEAKEFRRVLREAGCSCTAAKVALTHTKNLARWRKTIQKIEGWMDDWQLPVGVFVGDDVKGRIVAQMCRERGWRVPEDVAIIAGLNEEAICEHPRPSLSSVEIGYTRIGYEAARLLGRLMGGKKKKKKEATPEHILLPPKALVVRESTDFYAVDDALVAAALEFIAAHSHQRIGPDAVAKAVATEKRTLQRRFRKVLDRPIATEIRRVRIERAKRELAQTERTLASIARDVGFREPLRMYEIFCRELGVTPSAYRKQRQLEDKM
jgi:LacI family transcriptional regulator